MDKIITPFSNLKNKTGKHKDWYGVDFVKTFCTEVNPQNRYFSNNDFISQYKQLHLKLELKDRLNLLTSLLDEFLSRSYEKKLKILTPLLGEKWPFEDGMFTHGYFLFPLSQFVEVHGAENVKLSLGFIEELTMRFTGEWAIRTIANANEKEVLRQMKEWAKHENFHIRRLASEGLRARLPWGKKIDWVDQKPEKTLPIYNKLRNDKVLYVRRSVANSMGDMIKINEDLAYETFQKWLGQKKTKENLWVIKHAIRTPVKKKNKKFMNLKGEVELLLKSL